MMNVIDWLIVCLASSKTNLSACAATLGVTSCLGMVSSSLNEGYKEINLKFQNLSQNIYEKDMIHQHQAVVHSETS